MRTVVIVAAKRTAIGEFGGSLKNVPVAELGATVLRACLIEAGVRPMAPAEPGLVVGGGGIDLEERYGDYEQSLQPIRLDEVIMGNVNGAGQGQHVTRQATIKAGIPKETSCFTVNKVCGSGLKAVSLAAQAIACGDAEAVLAGGMENMSQHPYVLNELRWGARLGDVKALDSLLSDTLMDAFYGYHMGITAENLAQAYGISREEQDAFAMESHQRALVAIADGLFADEIAPVIIPQRKGDPAVFATDERPAAPRPERMAALRPAFRQDGSVTAGNASGINDGAAALLLLSEDKARALGLKPLAVFKGQASAAVDPSIMGIGPVPAVHKLLARTGLAFDAFDAIELNEAFAAQSIAVMRELGADARRTNRLGGAIALGHPVGCSGARILVTLLHQLVREELRYGLASLCIGGGMGIAAALERRQAGT